MNFARTLLQIVWPATLRARWNVARRADGRERARAYARGGELSLRDPLLPDWLLWKRRAAPQLSLRAEAGDSYFGRYGQTAVGVGFSGSMPYLPIASLTLDGGTASMSESAFMAATAT